MSRVINNIEIELDEELSEKLQWMAPNHASHRILRQSLDARRKVPRWVYTVEVFDQGEVPPPEDFQLTPISWSNANERPIIVGCGPAGLFAALRFVERGVPCVLIERGDVGLKRIQAINTYWKHGILDPDNNVCFGEGGAGLYSDGKLITRIKSPHIPYVMSRMVQFGAPAEIQYLANPHVGSNRIRKIIPKMREFLTAHGCEFHFSTRMTGLMTDGSQVVGIKTDKGEFRSHHVILATGHSAEDVYDQMFESGVKMEGKSFAMGLRIEHPQELINRAQYRDAYAHPALGAANYKLAETNPDTGVGVYSFCMCPGGYVLSSGTGAEGVVCNGMSNYARNSGFANSAIVVTVDHQKRFGTSLEAGLQFRREVESRALEYVRAQGGKKELPAQSVTDFLKQTSGEILSTSSPSGVKAARLDQLFPHDMYAAMQTSLQNFSKRIPGFIGEKGQLHGVESRTSSPIRIIRNEKSLESLSHRGLYPTGEGAGYAGGITSAACDGIRVAEVIIAQFTNVK